MWYALIMVVGTALTLCVPGAAAGGQDTGIRKTVQGRQFQLSTIQGQLEDVANRRVRIGVTVSLDRRATDSLGAFIEAVTPGDPADKAGIRVGDILTKMDGQSLATTRRQQQLPADILGRLLSRHAPYDTVQVEFFHQTPQRYKTVPVVVVPRLDPEDDTALSSEDRLNRVVGLITSPLGSLELARLNPDLGQYFGATDGILVVTSPPEAKLGLKGGDVIVAANGNKLSDPNRLLWLLYNHRGNKGLKLDVLRNRKRMMVTVTIPDSTPSP